MNVENKGESPRVCNLSIGESASSIRVRSAPFIMGVLEYTSLGFQYVVRRFPANIVFSPSAPAVGGYASIS